IKQYAAVCEVWNQGFRPSTSDPRFAKGMEARIVTDKPDQLLFAGFETSTSLAVRLLYELALNPAAAEEAEHKAVRAEHGPTLGLAALKDMTYTEAAISETLRIGQIVANVPRIATRAINTPRAPAVPAGCPFSASFCGQSVLDPAAEGSQAAFNPERWLDPKNKASLKLHQHPFGYGTHSCLGYRIARAVAAALAQELALAYDFSADTNTTFSDFPTGSRPANELPLSLKPLRAVE
ncbi:cytochrome P450, partial [Scenedesmus sp. NREL 46B-D3]